VSKKKSNKKYLQRNELITLPRVGLVLTGGGARAAYQAGVIRGISDMLGNSCQHIPFQVMTGISAGAINASYLASKADCFSEAVKDCYHLWNNLKAEHILKTDVVSLTRLTAQWMRDLSLGGVFKGARTTYLLNTEPLKLLLEKSLDFSRIRNAIDRKLLHGIAISATNYRTGTAVTFYDGAEDIVPWARSFRIGKRAKLSLKHVLASAAIPILFQPVSLERSYFGDGSIRLRAPISPAIHLGADRVIAIGIRYYRPEDMTKELNTQTKMDTITVADIAGVMLNAAFMDSLEADIERMERINLTIALMSEESRLQHPHQLRSIPLLVIRPSEDLGRFACDQFDRFPRVLRHLLNGIGASNQSGWDLLSYLSFDKSYTGPLLELGYQDALRQRTEILAFLSP
jgi:NTE family protein